MEDKYPSIVFTSDGLVPLCCDDERQIGDIAYMHRDGKGDEINPPQPCRIVHTITIDEFVDICAQSGMSRSRTRRRAIDKYLYAVSTD